ncbi:MAG: caspase family protein, partial [Pseudomonadales bacterium]|nr:caspase family protein [Pseudomonadales bacterium]
MRSLQHVIAVLLFLLSPGLTMAGERVALVIGNAAYRDLPLANPVNDASAMSDRLQELGFEVVTLTDASLTEMQQGLGRFLNLVQPGSTAMVFYAGHGIQANGRNYLMPVDARPENEFALQFSALELNVVLDALAGSGSAMNILVLDACRNNPFERKTRGGSRGLAVVDAAAGTLIAYATAPGQVAADGEGEHGLYTGALLRALDQPGLKVEEVFKQVRIQVARASGQQQIPWESSSLTGDFVFNGQARTAEAEPGGQPVWAQPAAGLAKPAAVVSSCADLSGAWVLVDDNRACVDDISISRVTDEEYNVEQINCVSGVKITSVMAVTENRAVSRWSAFPCSGVSEYEFNETCSVATGRVVKRGGLPGVCQALV